MVAEIPEIGVAYIFFLETCTLLVVVVIVVVAAATVVKKKADALSVTDHRAPVDRRVGHENVRARGASVRKR